MRTFTIQDQPWDVETLKTEAAGHQLGASSAHTATFQGRTARSLRVLNVNRTCQEALQVSIRICCCVTNYPQTLLCLMISWVGNAGGAQQGGSSVPCGIDRGWCLASPSPFLCRLRVSPGPTDAAQTSYEISQDSLRAGQYLPSS